MHAHWQLGEHERWPCGGKRGLFAHLFARFRRGFMGHGGFMGPGGMRGGRWLGSDELQLIVLSLLNEKPRHGYEIIKALEEHSSGSYVPSPGMVYPALTYLEEMGFAISETEGTKKLYRITDAGSEHLNQHKATADEALERLAHCGKRVAYFREQMEQDEATTQEWGGSHKQQAKKEWRQLKEEFHELRQELKGALFEKLHSPMEEKQRILNVLRRAIGEIRGQ